MLLFFSLSLDKSDLHFIISSDGAGGAPLTEGGFAYMRASAKGTWGVKTGCYYFECKVKMTWEFICKKKFAPMLSNEVT